MIQLREYVTEESRLTIQPKYKQQFQPKFEHELEYDALDEPLQILQVANHPFQAQDTT